MNPLLRKPIHIVITFGLWIALGVLLGSLFSHYYRSPILQNVTLHLSSCLLLGVFSSSAYYVSQHFELMQRPFIRSLLLITGCGIIAGSTQIFILQFADYAISNSINQQELIAQQPGLLVIIFCLTAIIYAFSLVLYGALASVRQLRYAEQAEAAKELWAKSAELKALRAQINPHFLFNSLNSISALTSINPEKTRAMVIELSQFYRESLTVSDLPEISLARELTICNHFIAIESIRYGDKLQWKTDCTSAALNCLVPPLCLQPLLENAIKHGISLLSRPSCIHLKSDIQHNKLYLVLSNEIPTQVTNRKVEGTSTGLKNLKERLNLLYGDKAFFGWSQQDNIFSIELILPLQHDKENA